MIEVLAPLSKGLVQLLGVLSIGLLIAIAFLDKDIKGAVSNLGLIKKIKLFLIFWFVSLVLFILIQIAYLLEQPLFTSLKKLNYFLFFGLSLSYFLY